MQMAEPRNVSIGGIIRGLLAIPGLLLVGLARIYQYTLGAVLPDSCRFSPTCSQYFIQAVRKHGAIKGAWLGTRRILRCHPYGGSGHDPVP